MSGARERGLGAFLGAFEVPRPSAGARSCCSTRLTPCEFCTGERCRGCGLLVCRVGCGEALVDLVSSSGLPLTEDEHA